MIYRKKITILVSIIGALALVYILSIVFEPERRGERSAAYTWLDPKLRDKAGGIVIRDAGSTTELALKNNRWFVYFDGKEYPAKDMRVEDLLGLLSRRASYPLRASSASAQERLGLSEDSASRITISGGPGLPLLDLLIGRGDETGREVYLRRQGSNEIRSGEDVFTAYTAGQRTSWYNLRLFPESENGGLDLDSVQRLSVYAGGGAEPQVFSRSGREWVLSGMEVKEADTGKIDGYVRGILNAEGEDFSNTDPSDAGFNHSRIVLETGDGNIKTLRLTEAGESGGRLAAVSGSPHAYSLASWTADRLFREASYFEKQ